MSFDLPMHKVPMRFRGRNIEYERGSHFLTVEDGVEVRHVVNPEFWQHLAARMTVNDVLEVRGPDCGDMELRVVAIDPLKQWADVILLRHCDYRGLPVPGMEQVAPPRGVDAAGYRIDPNGPNKTWRIVQGRDVIAKDFGTEGEAHVALANLLAAAKRKAPA
jgi:hypothetical protein